MTPRAHLLRDLGTLSRAERLTDALRAVLDPLPRFLPGV